jgi:iron-sulfur cluster repair protein YtfE (RIC family)
MYADSREELLSFLFRASDVVSYLGVLTASGFRVVFPPKLLKAFQRGEIRLLESSVGPGYAPTLVGDNGQFVGQVRIDYAKLSGLDFNAIANATAHAQTHALLFEVLGKLADIEKQIAEVLGNQHAAWRAQIAAGISQLQTIELNPGDPHSRAATLANSLQSLTEGRYTGLLQLQEHLRHTPKPTRHWFWQFLNAPRLRLPSEVQACVIDRIEEDFKWLYSATVAISRVHTTCGREQSAQQELPEFARQLQPVILEYEHRFEWAQYSVEREKFLRGKLSFIRSLYDGRQCGLIVEFDKSEIQRLLMDRA